MSKDLISNIIFLIILFIVIIVFYGDVIVLYLDHYSVGGGGCTIRHYNPEQIKEILCYT